MFTLFVFFWRAWRGYALCVSIARRTSTVTTLYVSCKSARDRRQKGELQQLQPLQINGVWILHFSFCSRAETFQGTSRGDFPRIHEAPGPRLSDPRIFRDLTRSSAQTASPQAPGLGIESWAFILIYIRIAQGRTSTVTTLLVSEWNRSTTHWLDHFIQLYVSIITKLFRQVPSKWY